MTPDLLPLLPNPSRHAALLSSRPTKPTVEVPIDEVDNPRLDLAVFLFQTGTYLDRLTGNEGLGKRLGILPWAERAVAVPKELVPLLPSLAADVSFPPSFLVRIISFSLVLISLTRGVLFDTDTWRGRHLHPACGDSQFCERTAPPRRRP